MKRPSPKTTVEPTPSTTTTTTTATRTARKKPRREPGEASRRLNVIVALCEVRLAEAMLAIELPLRAFETVHCKPLSDMVASIEPTDAEAESQRHAASEAFVNLRKRVDAMRAENARLARLSDARSTLLWMVEPAVQPARPYHYLRWGNSSVRDRLVPEKWGMPLAHVPLVEPNFALLPQLQRWAEHQAAYLPRASGCQLYAYSSYCLNDYARYWEAFEQRPDDPGTVHPNAAHLRSLFFDNAWMGEVDLPVGAVLFEGQGLYERDLLDRAASLAPGDVFESRRPRSTTYIPNVALHFLGGNEYKVPGVTRGELLTYSPDENYDHYAIRRGHYRTEGCLAVLRVACTGMRAAFRHGIVPTHAEAEITLQPFLRMVCTAVRRDVELPCVHLNRISIAALPRKISILYFDVYPNHTRAQC